MHLSTFRPYLKAARFSALGFTAALVVFYGLVLGDKLTRLVLIAIQKGGGDIPASAFSSSWLPNPFVVLIVGLLISRGIHSHRYHSDRSSWHEHVSGLTEQPLGIFRPLREEFHFSQATGAWQLATALVIVFSAMGAIVAGVLILVADDRDQYRVGLKICALLLGLTIFTVVYVSHRKTFESWKDTILFFCTTVPGPPFLVDCFF